MRLFQSQNNELELRENATTQIKQQTNNLSQLYINQEKWTEAYTHAEAGLRMDPNYVQAYYRMGLIDFLK